MTVNNTLRIFLVDDDIFYKALFQQLMNSLGYTRVYFYNTVEEILADDIEDTDIIFYDYGLDAAAGIETLKKLKKKNFHVYVVLISANEDERIIEDAVKHGAFSYVIKGHNEAERINKILSKIKQIQCFLNNQTGGLKSIQQ
jgi:response regulator of citrate/malate metabolism